MWISCWLAFLGHTHLKLLSKKFQCIIRSLGESVAGNVKLFHFESNTDYAIQVTSLLVKNGFWVYQLMATWEMAYRLSFMGG